MVDKEASKNTYHVGHLEFNSVCYVIYEAILIFVTHDFIEMIWHWDIELPFIDVNIQVSLIDKVWIIKQYPLELLKFKRMFYFRVF